MERRSFVFAVASAVVAPWLPDVGRLLPGRPVRDALPPIPPGVAVVQARRGAESWTYEPVSPIGRTCVVEVKRLGRGHHWRAAFHGTIERVQFDGPTLGPRITLVSDDQRTDVVAAVSPMVPRRENVPGQLRGFSGETAWLDKFSAHPHEWRLRFLLPKAS